MTFFNFQIKDILHNIVVQKMLDPIDFHCTGHTFIFLFFT